MEMLVIIAVASFLVGRLPVERFLGRFFDKYSVAGTGAFLEATKAVVAIWLGNWLNGSLGAMALAAIAAITGQIRSPAEYTEQSYPKGFVTAAVSAGIIAPLSLPLMGGIWLTCRVLRRPLVTAAIWTAIFIPVFLFRFYVADMYFVFGSVLAGLIINQYLGYVERTCEAPGHEPTTASRKARAQAYRLRILFRKVAILCLVAALITGFYLTRYVYRGFGHHVEIFRRGPSTLPLVALTFDDGPNPRYTPEILDILRDNDVKATFFMLGRNAELYPDVAKRVAEEGHEIGNHTHRHLRLFRTSCERSKTELSQAEEAIRLATGVSTRLVRPPQGLYGPGSLEAARDLRYTVVLWSLSSRDWTEIAPRDIARAVVSRAQNGEVILFHDGGDLFSYTGGDRTNTVKALPYIIEGLRDKGFTFVTVTEMMIALGLTGEE